jgi:hypothetical protein
MQGAFAAAEAVCHDVLAAIASAREKRQRVNEDEERHFVEQAERFQLALEDGEVVEERGGKRNGAKTGKRREKEPESVVVGRPSGVERLWWLKKRKQSLKRSGLEEEAELLSPLCHSRLQEASAQEL